MNPQESGHQPASDGAGEGANDTPWQFHDDTPAAPAAPAAGPPQTPNGPNQPHTASAPHQVEWTASEFVAHQKGAGWYLLLAVAAVVAAGLVYLLTNDMVAAAVIIFAGLAFGIFAARKPRVLRYRVDGDGLHIEEKLYHYGNFKSFAVIEEDAIHSVLLLPMKRFMPALTVYYAPEDEPKIVDALAAYLPLQPAQNDLIDRLMRKIRF